MYQSVTQKTGNFVERDGKMVDEYKDVLYRIETIDELKALMDSEQNKRIVEKVQRLVSQGLGSSEACSKVKKQLLSVVTCLPKEGTEDGGLLAGSLRPSRLVFSDYDHLDSELYSRVKARVLEIADEIGLAFGGDSVRGEGIHLIYTRDPSLSQEENLERVDALIGIEGVKHDPACKNINRKIFMPTSDSIWYLSPDLITLSEQECPYVRTPSNSPLKGENKGESKPSSSSPQPAPAEATPASLYAFDKVTEQAGLTSESLDTEGFRHNNLLAILSAGLPKLLTREQIEACVSVRMPSYADEADCTQLISDFFDNYSADKTPMTKELREVNASMQNAQTVAEWTSTAQRAQEKQEPTRLWSPPSLPKKLPRLLELDLKAYPKLYHETLAVAHSPLLGAHASHYRTLYVDDKTVIAPNTYVAVTAFSQGGKSQVTDLKKEMLAHTLLHDTRVNFAEHKKVKELRNDTGSGSNKPKECKLPIYVCETVSESSFLKVMETVGEEGMIFCFYPEADLLATKAAKGSLNEILKEAWDGDPHNQKYATDAAVDYYGNVRASILTLGTAGAVIARYFGQNNNGESGTRNRFMTVPIPEEETLSFLPPKGGRLTLEEESERDGYLMKLWQQNLALGDGIKMLDMPKTYNAVEKWCTKWEKRYQEGFIDEAEGILIRRVAQSMMRTAMPFVALEGKESKELIDYITWLGDYVYYYQCKLFADDIRKERELTDILLKRKHDGRCTDLGGIIYQFEVGTTFTSQQFYQKFEEAGGTYENAKTTLSRLKNKKKNPIVLSIGRGLYQRIS